MWVLDMQKTSVALWRCLFFDRNGVTTVEFALIAPALIFVVMGMVELSLLMFTQSVLDGATQTASRLGKTGYEVSGSTREQTILSAVNARAGQLMNTANITITKKSYAQFDQIGDPEPFVDTNGNGVRDQNENYTDVNLNGQYDTDMGASNYGSAGEVVVYTVTYPWQFATPVVAAFFSGGSVTLSSRVVVLNEPY